MQPLFRPPGTPQIAHTPLYYTLVVVAAIGFVVGMFYTFSLINESMSETFLRNHEEALVATSKRQAEFRSSCIINGGLIDIDTYSDGTIKAIRCIGSTK